MEHNNSKSNDWYEKTSLVIILCILFFPVGLYALWKNSRIAKGWKIGISALFAIILLASLTDNEENSNKIVNEKQENIIDIKTIIGKTESEIEKILGKAENSEKVSPSNTPCKDTPCEKKFYQKNKFEIVYINDKSDWITINDVSNFACNAENIILLGLPSTTPSFENATSVNWNNIENINEIIFSNNGKDKINYIYIKAVTK